jgi:hypothetical protein
MTVHMSNEPAPEWTFADWETFLAWAEARRANGLAGRKNADGSMTMIFDDGEGLDHLRGVVADMRAEVAAMEAAL